MKHRLEHVDVLVVGLGPAGSSAAAEAARAGHRVLAIDRKRVAGTPVQCAELVPRMLASEVTAVRLCAQQPIDAMRTFIEDDPADVEPNFPGHMLDRAAFDAALMQEAIAAGAQCALGVTARVGQDAVRLSNGCVVQTRVIVGADGPHSDVGHAIGSVNRQCVETRQITVPLLHPQRSTDIFLSAAIPGGYGWLFPKGDIVNLGAGVVPEHRAALKAIVSRLHTNLVRDGVVGETILAITGGAIPVGGMLEPVGALDDTLVLLAGDAAGLTNPISGAGIASAVLSGRLAGRAAAAYLDGDSDAPRSYRDELDALFGASLKRALHHRRALEEAWHGHGAPSKALLRRGWIAYPEYWAGDKLADVEVMA